MRIGQLIRKSFVILVGLSLAYSLYYLIRYYPHYNPIQIDEIYVINLDRSHERYAKIKANLDDLGLKHTRFSAVDGYTLGIADNTGKIFHGSDLKSGKHKINPEKPYKILCPTIALSHNPQTDGRYTLNPGEYGCYCSHLEIWNEIVEKNIKYALVLEDDAHFTEGSLKKLNRVINHAPKDFDILYLYCDIQFSKKRLQKFNIFVNLHGLTPVVSYRPCGLVQAPLALNLLYPEARCTFL